MSIRGFAWTMLLGLICSSVVIPPTWAGSSAIEESLLRGSGLAFPDPWPDLGESLELVGRITMSESVPPFESTIAEYTWTLTGPVVHSVDEPAPGIRTLHLTFGVLEIREDVAINSEFEPDPPNAEVPSSFRDGDVKLLGTLTDFRIRQIFGLTTATGSVQFEAGDAVDGLGAWTHWSFDAAVSAFGDEIPVGYGAHWNLELAPLEPVSLEATSWTSVKALYR